MARFASEAERLRAHREAFLLAQELGCTPKEAEAEIARIAARERHRARMDRLAAKMAAPVAATPIHMAEPEGPRSPWYKREDY